MNESTFRECPSVSKKDPDDKSNRSMSFYMSFVLDYKFWSTGAISINLHSRELEIEFLCFGFYISKA